MLILNSEFFGMSHSTVTPDPEKDMVRQPHLMRRKGRYYLNRKVPQDLQKILGKEVVRESLKTSDHATAVKNLRIRLVKWDARFDQERRKLTFAESTERTELSEQEIQYLAHEFFIECERDRENWWNQTGRYMDEDDTKEVIENVGTELAIYEGGSPYFLEQDGDCRGTTLQLLKEKNYKLSKKSASFQRLSFLIRKAAVESASRQLDRLYRKQIRPKSEFFREISSHTILKEAKPPATLKQLTTGFLNAQKNVGRASVTLRTYVLPCRLLSEFFGEKQKLDAIEHSQVEKFLDLLRRAPTNAIQRYPGKSLAESVAEADRNNDPHRLRAKSLKNYFNNISAIFNYGVEAKLIAENPFKNRWLKQAFLKESEDDEENVAPFEISELNLLFKAPLYTGCVDDFNNYRKPGPNHPRRGRFWVPLISLFQGLRCNEACQLHTADVQEADGIPFILVTSLVQSDSTAKSDKRVKSKQSRRKVPIHSEVLKLGFLDYVKERQKDTESNRLFPDLPASKTGYYSDKFSKWFGRFRTAILGKESKANFHSMRRNFRTGLGEAGVPLTDIELLGGWSNDGRSSEKVYDFPTLQRLHRSIEKLEYPGLEVSHLYQVQHSVSLAAD